MATWQLYQAFSVCTLWTQSGTLSSICAQPKKKQTKKRKAGGQTDSLDSDISNFLLGLKSFLNHSQANLTFCSWARGEAIFQVGVDMCRRQMFLGQVSCVLGVFSDCVKAQVEQLLLWVSHCIFTHLFPGLKVHVHSFSTYRWPPELPHRWKASSSPPQSYRPAPTCGCPDPRGATSSSEHRPGRQLSHPTGWWPSLESHPGPCEPELPLQSSSASHTGRGMTKWNTYWCFRPRIRPSVRRKFNIILIQIVISE